MTRSYLYLRAKAGGRQDLLDALGRLEILTAIRDQPGFLGAELQVPFDDEDDVLLSTAWASREHYERWLTDSARDDILGGVSGLVAEEPAIRLYRVADAVQSGPASRLAN